MHTDFQHSGEFHLQQVLRSVQLLKATQYHRTTVPIKPKVYELNENNAYLTTNDVGLT